MRVMVAVGAGLQVTCGLLALLVALPIWLVLAPFLWLADCWREADEHLLNRRPD